MAGWAEHINAYALPKTKASPGLANSMAAPPPPPPAELIEEILLRLPPDEPSYLLRASLVCKPWRRIISHRRFCRRLHELHGRPPVLGFLRNNDRMGVKDFVATTSLAFSLAVPGIGDLTALDCRHGRALLLDMDMDMVPGSGELVVWDPITGDQERVPVPEAWDNRFQSEHPTAAIVCAAAGAGCDHRGCHGRPFKLVMVYSDSSSYDDDEEDQEWVTWACSYSSETNQWGEAIHFQDFATDFTMHTTSVLVGDSLLYFMSDCGTIIEYDLAGEDASTISTPQFQGDELVALILTEDGGLGAADSSDSHLNIWSRVVGDYNDPALWVKSRVISLDNLLPAALLEEEDVRPMSFAGRANTLFIRTTDGIFTIELQSERVRKVCEHDDDDDSCSLVPIEGFYTPRASQGEEA